jgi:hypothetical protein
MPIAGANMVRKDFRGALFSLLGLFAGTDAGANTLVVTDLGDATGDLVCDAQCTLLEAIAAASSGDTTWSRRCRFRPQRWSRVRATAHRQNLTLLGHGAHQLTLDAQNASEAPWRGTADDHWACPRAGACKRPGNPMRRGP